MNVRSIFKLVGNASIFSYFSSSLREEKSCQKQSKTALKVGDESIRTLINIFQMHSFDCFS